MLEEPSAARRNERDYPHIVEIPVPEGGLGDRFDSIIAWHRSHDITTRRGTVRRDNDAYFVRWCFADADDATAFALAFVGELVPAP